MKLAISKNLVAFEWGQKSITFAAEKNGDLSVYTKDLNSGAAMWFETSPEEQRAIYDLLRVHLNVNEAKEQDAQIQAARVLKNDLGKAFDKFKKFL